MSKSAPTDSWFSGVLRHRMPLGLRCRLIWFLLTGTGNTARREQLFAELRRRRTLTAPRESIDWFPSIDKSCCNACGVCLAFCPKDVFSQTEDGHAVAVTRPYQCVLLCRDCVAKCRAGAITFPPVAPFRRFVVYR